MKSIADLSILVVEDEPLQRAFLVEHLRRLGAARLLEAGDGAEATRAMERHAVDLIFCDIGLPNMDGPQFVLRQLERAGGDPGRHRALPMLVWMSVLDAGILESHSRLAGSAGFDMVGALSKPLSPASLAATLELVLALAQSRRRRRRPEDGQAPAVGEDDLLRAICGIGELEVWYRPTLALESGLIAGAEAQVRWNHPSFRQLCPERFMALIESQGLGLVLFYRTVNHALRVLRKLKAGGHIVSMGIKASAQTLRAPEIADYLAERIRQHQLSPDQLCVILADGGAASDLHLSASLNRMRIKGFRLFLDAFGAGGAHLEMLAEMPFNGIRIDAGLVGRMARHPASRDIVDTLLGMGRRLGLPVIAGGVDGEQTRALLRGMQCPLAQGNIAPPLRGDDFLRAVRLERIAKRG